MVNILSYTIISKCINPVATYHFVKSTVSWLFIMHFNKGDKPPLHALRPNAPSNPLSMRMWPHPPASHFNHITRTVPITLTPKP